MAIQNLQFTIIGIDPLLVNNPQVVDPFNKFKKEISAITAKRSKTEEDLLALRDLEIRSKIYWDDKKGIYIPSQWVLASIAGCSFKQAKISKDTIRAAVFVTESKIPLQYANKNLVKTPLDIVKNDEFRIIQILPQGQVRVTKAAPIFNDWSFTAEVEFDDSVVDLDSLKKLIKYGAKFGGFGDFRPTYGRATVEFA